MDESTTMIKKEVKKAKIRKNEKMNALRRMNEFSPSAKYDYLLFFPGCFLNPASINSACCFDHILFGVFFSHSTYMSINSSRSFVFCFFFLIHRSLQVIAE